MAKDYISYHVCLSVLLSFLPADFHVRSIFFEIVLVNSAKDLAALFTAKYVHIFNY